eukprot:TRINITY_DN80959_c0_g1_i1.p1 TRINITY_DN80959_c0_g1~~TRINITY_DN80959_c0_g1_i1.p1  ORF type:complete len:215 (-),score=32.09 TRINITY_DN80959_c0_g1_i1:76-720(-)
MSSAPRSCEKAPSRAKNRQIRWPGLLLLGSAGALSTWLSTEPLSRPTFLCAQRSWGAKQARGSRAPSSSIGSRRQASTGRLVSAVQRHAGPEQPVQNILGTELQLCSADPLTGWYRDGFCRTDDTDRGRHLVCVETNEQFLEHQRKIGNDLSTPAPMYGFPGLKPGDSWCVCASRWAEAVIAGVNAPVKAHATHAKAKDFAPQETLMRLALDAD